jgi:senataxin
MKILANLSQMSQFSIMLVQGPPGTGKTSTILGIISMVLATHSKKKIHLCAPSNGAVDEILMRICSKGLKGTD